MPAPSLTNSFEGGSAGATIATTDTGSGDAWSAVTIGAGATLTYDATNARGNLAAKVAQPVSPTTTYLRWSGFGSLAGNVYGRAYFFLTALPTASLFAVEIRSNALANSGVFIFNTSGFVRTQNAAFANGGVGVVAVPTNAWFRFEWRIVSSTTVGEMEWKLFGSVGVGDGPDGTTPFDTLNQTGLVLAANTDALEIGMPQNAVASTSVWMDDIAVATSGWIGPSGRGNVLYPSVPFMSNGRI